MHRENVAVKRAIEKLATAARDLGKSEILFKAHPVIGEQPLHDAQIHYMESLAQLHELLGI